MSKNIKILFDDGKVRIVKEEGLIDWIERYVAAEDIDGRTYWDHCWNIDTSENKQVRHLAEAMEFMRTEIESLKAAKDGAYSERNKLVALISKIFPASIEKHDGWDWEEEWRNVVLLQLPTGQVSWHIHDSELPMFAHLATLGNKWDGHTTDEKYDRVAACPMGDFQEQ